MCLSVVLWPEEMNSPENVHPVVHVIINKRSFESFMYLVPKSIGTNLSHLSKVSKHGALRPHRNHTSQQQADTLAVGDLTITTTDGAHPASDTMLHVKTPARIQSLDLPISGQNKRLPYWWQSGSVRPCTDRGTASHCGSACIDI